MEIIHLLIQKLYIKLIHHFTLNIQHYHPLIIIPRLLKKNRRINPFVYLCIVNNKIDE